MMLWKMYTPHALDLMGFIPSFLSVNDPRPAAEQFNENYAHGGGWRPLKGWVFDKNKRTIKYPGDPVYRPVAETELHGETVIVYQDAWVLIEKADGSYEVCRMD